MINLAAGLGDTHGAQIFFIAISVRRHFITQDTRDCAVTIPS